ncbi:MULTISPECIES: phage tail protein [Enterobacteriaceae]|uniref:phage tail protein n=1 Tax=Enterobacteriaceae TaxID=543 RepID=UPI0025A04767|nr:phage tail protein [Klebsiella pneumoniae]EAT3775304.1 phage tail protein [Salmonella enterica]EJF0838655.1 phage tail protein [Salmonella enterica]MCJ7341711.1 phage tail protein [Klebsiella pneumoniae]MDM7040793.1 phage tail protein [Klebsiella pneumoniae]MDM7102276.1 phage tail protein [Klebsiella pneumoniae]
MTTTVSDKLYKSKILDYYYQRRAESSISVGDRFLISKAVFGTSALVTKNDSGEYDIADLPRNFSLADMTSQFCTIPLKPTYADGVITIRMDLDQTQLEEGTSYPFNTLAVLDNLDQPIAIMCVQEDSLYVGKTYTAVMGINTTIA